MKCQIVKYEIMTKKKFQLELPRGYEILSVNSDNTCPHIFALVDPSAEKEVVNFEIFHTGADIEYGKGIVRKYIGSFKNSLITFHLFRSI